MSLLIVLRAVRSPAGADEELELEREDEKQNLARAGWDLLVGMFRTVFKSRPGWMTTCILLQLVAYTMVKFHLPETFY